MYSFTEYDFLDVALERALSTFEVALIRRYVELEGEKSNQEKELGDLINWANKNGLFEDSKSRVDKVRELRNELIGHPKGYSLFGQLAFHFMFPIVDLINGLYADVELRKERKKETREVNKEIDKLLRDGSINRI